MSIRMIPGGPGTCVRVSGCRFEERFCSLNSKFPDVSDWFLVGRERAAPCQCRISPTIYSVRSSDLPGQVGSFVLPFRYSRLGQLRKSFRLTIHLNLSTAFYCDDIAQKPLCSIVKVLRRYTRSPPDFKVGHFLLLNSNGKTANTSQQSNFITEIRCMPQTLMFAVCSEAKNRFWRSISQRTLLHEPSEAVRGSLLAVLLSAHVWQQAVQTEPTYAAPRTTYTESSRPSCDELW